MTKTRKTMKLMVRLNGTDKNPFLEMNLKQNPFPQLGRAEYDAGELLLNKLGAEPIKDVQQIRDTLAHSMTDEFIELCCERFVPGEYVEFPVHWEEG